MKKEDGVVILVNTFSQLRMKHSTFRAIVADNVKEVMKGNTTTCYPDNGTIFVDNRTMPLPDNVTIHTPGVEV